MLIAVFARIRQGGGRAFSMLAGVTGGSNLHERSMWLLNMSRIDMGAAVQLPVEEFTETGLGFMSRNGQLSRGGWNN